MIQSALRIAKAPKAENAEAIAAIIEGLQQLEATGDAIALNQVGVMVAGCAERVTGRLLDQLTELSRD